MFSSNSTALDMRAVGSKSNGALRWSASNDFSCEDTFNEKFYSSLGEYSLHACASKVFTLNLARLGLSQVDGI